MPRILQNENLKLTFKMCALKSIVFTYFMCVCICVCMCPSVRSGQVVRALEESMLSLYHVKPRDQMHRADGCLYSVLFHFHPVLDPES